MICLAQPKGRRAHQPRMEASKTMSQNSAHMLIMSGVLSVTESEHGWQTRLLLSYRCFGWFVGKQNPVKPKLSSVFFSILKTRNELNEFSCCCW